MKACDACDTCAGTGVYYKPVGRKRKCRCCFGTGQYRPHRVCSVCDGSGESFANNTCVCDGIGVHFYEEPRPCAACRGKGTYRRTHRKRCTECQGSGKKILSDLAMALIAEGL